VQASEVVRWSSERELMNEDKRDKDGDRAEYERGREKRRERGGQRQNERKREAEEL